MFTGCKFRNDLTCLFGRFVYRILLYKFIRRGNIYRSLEIVARSICYINRLY